MPIYKAVATGNRKNKVYRETARSNWKKPSIATMPDYGRITVVILTPLIFRYHLPLTLSYLSKINGYLYRQVSPPLKKIALVCYERAMPPIQSGVTALCRY
jgi:hypothetical protein